MQDQAIFSVILDQLIYLSISKDYIKYCFFGVYVYISDQPMKNHDTNSNVRSNTNQIFSKKTITFFAIVWP